MLNKIFALCVCVFLVYSPSAFSNDDVYKVSNYVDRNGLKIHSHPKVGGKVLATIPPSTSWIKIQGNPKAGWQKISWNSQQGWVKSEGLELDRAATNLTDKKVGCLHDPSVENKMCCGIVETTDDPSELVKIYSVTGVSKSGLLPINTAPGKSRNIVSLVPHNATWIMKLDQKKRANNGTFWEKVKWGNIVGWVDGSKIQYSPELTAVNDTKRKACNKPANCEPDLSALEKKS